MQTQSRKDKPESKTRKVKGTDKGDKKMRRKDREVTDDYKIDEIIRKCKICRIGFYDKGQIYMVPLTFGFAKEDGKRILYFHSAGEGRKVDLVKTSPDVGFEMDTGYELWEADEACDFSAGFQSVIGNGKITMVEEKEEKIYALETLMATSTGKQDWEFQQQMLEAVCVFKLVMEELSCKEHLRKN